MAGADIRFASPLPIGLFYGEEYYWLGKSLGFR
jgi:hypothetical protein